MNQIITKILWNRTPHGMLPLAAKPEWQRFELSHIGPIKSLSFWICSFFRNDIAACSFVHTSIGPQTTSRITKNAYQWTLCSINRNGNPDRRQCIKQNHPSNGLCQCGQCRGPVGWYRNRTYALSFRLPIRSYNTSHQTKRNVDGWRKLLDHWISPNACHSLLVERLGWIRLFPIPVVSAFCGAYRHFIVYLL